MESFHFLEPLNNGDFSRSKYLGLTLSGFPDGSCCFSPSSLISKRAL
jgi:hypothetical protein